jgi:hypothetical protein
VSEATLCETYKEGKRGKRVRRGEKGKRGKVETHVELAVLLVKPDIRFDAQYPVRKGRIDWNVSPVVVVRVDATLCRGGRVSTVRAGDERKERKLAYLRDVSREPTRHPQLGSVLTAVVRVMTLRLMAEKVQNWSREVEKQAHRLHSVISTRWRS